MDRLYFGARARRRARLKRVLFWASLLSLAATLAGIPGAGAGLDLIERWTPGKAQPKGGIETSESITSMRRFQQSAFETRPTPSPSPTPTPETVSEIISAAAIRHGLDPDYLLGVAECESGLDPNAYNSAGYHGLFQFDQTTWSAYGNGDIFDPAAQAEAAASLLAQGQHSRWPICAY